MLCFVWLALLFSTAALAAEQSVAPAFPYGGKIAPEPWSKAQAGETQELIVLLDAAQVDTEARIDMARRGLQVEDRQATENKARGYDGIKSPVFAQLLPDEAEIKRNYSHLPMASIRFKGKAGLERLLASGSVLAVYENRRLKKHLAEALPLVSQPSVSSIMNRKGEGATVAVLDTGLNYTRSEFGSCTAPGVPAATCRVVAAVDTAFDDGALDEDGHGTEVSATVLGVAPLAKIAAIDVFDGADGYSSDIIAGINWAIANRTTYNIKAINMSLGTDTVYSSACTDPAGPAGDPYVTPIGNARSAGMVVVVSSGNGGSTTGISSPACVANAFAVGAVYDANVGGLNFGICTDSTTAADKVTCYSNSNSLIDMLAPGSVITVVGASVHGTSFSAPMVSGAVAVLGAAFSAETAAQLEARLTSTGTAVLDTRNSVTKPRLNLLKAQGAPANDAFSAAVMLSGDSGSATGWNFNATKESGEPSHAGNAGGASAWWVWTATSSGTVTLDTHGSGFNTLLAVYTGSAVNALTSIASNNDDGSANNASGLSFHADAGVTYRIAVDGNAAASGAVTLNRSFVADPPPNADLQISLDDAPDPLVTGDTLTYTLTVDNLGSASASGVTITHTLPSGVTFVSADSGCSHSLGTVTCALGTLANGATVVRSVLVTATAAGTYQSQADVGSSTADNNTANNTATVTSTIIAESTAGNPEGGGEGEAPLPVWALLLLGAGLLGAMRKRLI